MSDPNGCNNCQRYSRVSAKSLETPKTKPSYKAATEPVRTPEHCGTQGAYSSAETPHKQTSLQEVETARGRFYPATIKDVIKVKAACEEQEVAQTIGTCKPDLYEPSCLDENVHGNAVSEGYRLPNVWLDAVPTDKGIPCLLYTSPSPRDRG